MTGYHSDRTCVSRGDLALFASSRRQYKIQRVDNDFKQEESVALKVGTATHAIALKDAFELDRLMMIPEEVANAKGKGSKNLKTRFRLKHRDKNLLTPGQFRNCEQLAANLLEVPVIEGEQTITIGDLVNHPKIEREFEWRWEDILPCRLKADLVVPLKDLTICIDLKTSKDISERAFRAEVKHRRLWLQSSHYESGLIDAFKNPVRFVFVAIEKTGMFNCEKFELDDETKELAREGRTWLLNELKTCMESGVFIDPKPEGIKSVRLSRADMGIPDVTSVVGPHEWTTHRDPNTADGPGDVHVFCDKCGEEMTDDNQVAMCENR